MPDPTTCRPRIEGERESEIFTAVVALLVESGYDKLTFDAVATAVRASKATLYRRWPTKADLVLDAVAAQLAAPEEAGEDDDTGSLRSDLIAQACGRGGLCDDSPAVLGALVPAMHRDADLSAAFRRRFVQPKLDRALAAFGRAQERGEVGPHADLHLLANTLAAICVHDMFVFDIHATPERVAHVLDSVVLPAARATLGHEPAAPDAVGSLP
jgi:AcrR family transcriptional regulator